MLTPLVAMVRKDLQLFFSDRRAVIMGFVAPIAIASFFGAIFSGPGNGGEAARIPVALVDQDHSAVSLAISADASADTTLAISQPTADEARDGVRRGTITVAVVIPAGFGDAAGHAFFAGSDKPVLTHSTASSSPSRGSRSSPPCSPPPRCEVTVRAGRPRA